MKNVCKLSPKQRNYSNLMYCTQGQGLGGWAKGVVLNLSKGCRLLAVSNVYVGDNASKWWDISVCLSSAAGPCHTLGDESVAGQVTMKSLRVLLMCCGWNKFNKDYSVLYTGATVRIIDTNLVFLLQSTLETYSRNCWGDQQKFKPHKKKKSQKYS